MNYDVAVIGAGLSGLAAGIRLAHFGKKVVILETHRTCGGLNSFYRRGKRIFDVGLHSMTNYVPRGTRGAPLTKLLRQLRIPYDDLGLVQQTGCTIETPSCSLQFTNNYNVLRDSVQREFPDQLANFDRLTELIDQYDEISLDAPPASTRQSLSSIITNQQLLEMLLIPIMYYGNPAEHDMDLSQFAVMYKSIFQSGFARPEKGMTHVIDLLQSRYADAGGVLRLGTQVEELSISSNRVKTIRLSGGEEIEASQVISSAGLVETMRICSTNNEDALAEKCGRLSFVELIAVLDVEPNSIGIDNTILFYNNREDFTYERPSKLVDLSSGVICCPNNFEYKNPLPEGLIRITARASHPQWHSILGTDDPRRATDDARAEYKAAKACTEQEMLTEAIRHLPDFREHIVFTDLFTPLTISRFTGHLGGAVYGSPEKTRRGTTDIENLFLCGTDQGFLGIVGAMLSGISMANLHCLQ